MDGATWVTCVACGCHFKPGQGEEPECSRCGYILSPLQVQEQRDEEEAAWVRENDPELP